MSERCETDKTPQAKANATDKFNSIARHNQRHCLFDNAATTNQAIFSAIFNSLLVVRIDDAVPFREEADVAALEEIVHSALIPMLADREFRVLSLVGSQGLHLSYSL